MYRLQFILKQHTPIIHFQHDQDGATLRATEVKPKLDKFIISQIAEGGYDNGLKEAKANGWLVGDGLKPSLNYKIHIQALGNAQKYFVTSSPSSRNNDEIFQRHIKNDFDSEYLNETQYFGNNKNLSRNGIKDHHEVKLGILHDEIEIKILTHNRNLFDFINNENQNLLKAFFVLNNFGTRQSKGFGCFLPKKISEQELLDYSFLDSEVLGVFKKQSNASFQVKLKNLAKEYSKLKRGQSQVGRDNYEKSKIWEYLCNDQGLKWEKRKIKQHIIQHNPRLFSELKPGNPDIKIDDCNGNSVPDQGENYKFIRALLGLAEQYEFVKEDNSRVKVKITDNTPDRYKKIERFKSPIRFLITEDAIYLFVYSIDPQLHTYIDENNDLQKRKYKFKIDNISQTFDLEVPDNFDILDFVFRKINEDYEQL